RRRRDGHRHHRVARRTSDTPRPGIPHRTPPRRHQSSTAGAREVSSILGTDKHTGLTLTFTRKPRGHRRYTITTASGGQFTLNISEWLGLVELAGQWKAQQP